MSAALVDEVVRCAERTRSEDSARLIYVRDHHFEWGPPRRRGGLLHPVRKAAKAAGKAAWRRIGGDMSHMESEGYIEPRARRCMLDHGGFAQLYKDGEWWSGASGAPLAPVHQDGPPPHLDAWWLLDVPLGTTAASEVGVEDVRGTACRHLELTVDMARASDAAGGGLAVPVVDHFDELLALAVDVWIDGERIRRVHHRGGRERMEQTVTLELWEFGVETGGLDWERLPALRPVD